MSIRLECVKCNSSSEFDLNSKDSGFCPHCNFILNLSNLNYFQLFGLDNNSLIIDKKYTEDLFLSQMMKFHPDRFIHNKEFITFAESNSSLYNKAYDCLMNEWLLIKYILEHHFKDSLYENKEIKNSREYSDFLLRVMDIKEELDSIEDSNLKSSRIQILEKEIFDILNLIKQKIQSKEFSNDLILLYQKCNLLKSAIKNN